MTFGMTQTNTSVRARLASQSPHRRALEGQLTCRTVGRRADRARVRANLPKVVRGLARQAERKDDGHVRDTKEHVRDPHA